MKMIKLFFCVERNTAATFGNKTSGTFCSWRQKINVLFNVVIRSINDELQVCPSSFFLASCRGEASS